MGNQEVFSSDDQLPFVSVVISVFNEEKVIIQKIESLFNQDYPKEKLRIYIGSDASTDNTNDILTSISAKYSNLHFFPYLERRGKPEVVNELVEKAKSALQNNSLHVLLVTDANVILAPSTLKAMAKHFKNEAIAIVDANMVHTGIQSEGISKAENKYISGEVMLKNREGLLWGKMIGPFGGCYAIRADYYTRVPSTYLVDDFYVTMKTLEKGGMAINDLEAVCYEAVSHEIYEEYKRKSRISAGNFQNLVTFKHLWWPPFKTLNFAFFSHKVLRWWGPFFLICIILTSIILAFTNPVIYRPVFFTFAFGLIGAPLIDLFFNALKINVLALRGVRYFIIMNIALLHGFFKFLKGIKSNVWEPPKRT